MDEIIKIENLYKSFGDLEVLNNISLSINKGEVVCVIGPSGSGKTTLVRCINFLEKIDEGKIYVDGDIIVTTTDPSTNTGGSIAARQVVLTNPLTGQSATLDASSTGGVSRARVFFANM